MVLDAFVQALSCYGGVPRRVIIDNPKNGELRLALKGSYLPSAALGLDEPLRNGTGGLYARRGLAEGAG